MKDNLINKLEWQVRKWIRAANGGSVAIDDKC